MVKLRGKEEYPFYFGAKPVGLRLAGNLRRNMTNAEKLLWEYLRNRKIDGFRFRRQHPIGEFVPDFFCYELMLVIELDGEIHNSKTQSERDDERTKKLNKLGIKVIRFSNKEVENKITQVISQIRKNIQDVKPK